MSDNTSGNSSSLKNFFDLSDGDLSSSLNPGMSDPAYGWSVDGRSGGTCVVADVVVSSRVRLFRNLSDYPFPEVCSTGQKQAVADKIASGLTNGLASAANSPSQPSEASAAITHRPAILTPEQLETLERQCLIEFQAVIDAMASGVWSEPQPVDDSSMPSEGKTLSYQPPETLSAADIHDGETVELPVAQGQGDAGDPMDDSGTIEFRDAAQDELSADATAAKSQEHWEFQIPESKFRKQILVALDRAAFEIRPATDEAAEAGQHEVHESEIQQTSSPQSDARVMLSAVVNEEDHLQMQAMSAGGDLQPLWRQLSLVDDGLQARGVDFAYSQKWGFLTACPANVGTAMRAGVTLHLPALAYMGRLDNLFRWLMRGGLTAQGIYGDEDCGDTAWGDFYRIGNQITLGASETELLQRLAVVIPVIVDYEREARRVLAQSDRSWMRRESESAVRALKLQVQRSDKEMLMLVSALRLGIAMCNVSAEQVGRISDAFALSRLKQQLQFAIDQEQYDIATACRDRISELQERGDGN